jgi:hypothetical protein
LTNSDRHSPLVFYFKFISLDTLSVYCIQELPLDIFQLRGMTAPFSICTPLRFVQIRFEAQDDLLDVGGIMMWVLSAAGSRRSGAGGSVRQGRENIILLDRWW